MSFYKYCAVPMCNSTSISTPKKLFINVPKNANLRRKWFTLARRDPASLATTSTSYFCEDHFDLPNDMGNYIRYTTMGIVSRIIMRPGCLPTKFACQPTRPSSTSTDVCRPVPAKRQRLELIRECEEDIKAAELQQSVNLNIEVPSQDQDATQEQYQKITKVDKAVQISITSKYRSKTTQCQRQCNTNKTSHSHITERNSFQTPQNETRCLYQSQFSVFVSLTPINNSNID